MPTVTHKRLAKYKAAEERLRFFLNGDAWIEYSKIRETNRKRGTVIMLLACSLMSTVAVLFFYHF